MAILEPPLSALDIGDVLLGRRSPSGAESVRLRVVMTLSPPSVTAATVPYLILQLFLSVEDEVRSGNIGVQVSDPEESPPVSWALVPLGSIGLSLSDVVLLSRHVVEDRGRLTV